MDPVVLASLAPGQALGSKKSAMAAGPVIDLHLDTTSLLANDAPAREPMEADGEAAIPSMPNQQPAPSSESPGSASGRGCSANGSLFTERLLGAEPTFAASVPLNVGDEEQQSGASALVSPLPERAPSRSVSPSPAVAAPRQASVARTPFSLELASATLHAAERMAAKLIERLQTACTEQAAIGQYNLVWDAPLPSGRRLSDAVARCFAHQLNDLGFSRLEWWNGKEWSNRYGIIKDTMCDRYNLRLRVHWSGIINSPKMRDAPVWESNFGRQDTGGSDFGDATLRPLLQQLQQVMVLQHQVLHQAIAARAAAEDKAARAEERAVAAERQRCKALDSEGKFARATSMGTFAESQSAKHELGRFLGLHLCFCCTWGQAGS